MREIIHGPYKRSFHLPENIKEDKIKATYENGILVIKLQKDKARPLKKTIKVN
jgi:HSP20 family protein